MAGSLTKSDDSTLNRQLNRTKQKICVKKMREHDSKTEIKIKQSEMME